jgi:hypothetical protein
MSNVLEHFWFLPYSLEIRKFLQRSLYLSSYPKDKNVAVYYSTPSRVFAKFIVPVINGGNLTPMVTFNLQSQQPTAGQTPGGYFKKYQRSKINNEVWETLRHPLPYELIYRVTAWTARQSDMDILMYQAMTSAPFNRKYAVKVDGQWAEFEVKNVTPELNLDPGESQDVAIRYGFDIIVPRAYLPLNYEEYYGIIKDTDIVYDI